MYYKTSDQERIKLGFHKHECNNGVHFCGLYENEQERDEIILGYLRQGIICNDRVLYTPTERSVEDFYQKFSEKYPDDLSLLHENPNLTINTADDLYYENGNFSPLRMNKNLGKFYEAAQKDKKVNIRTTAEMIWVLDKNLDKTKHMAYESLLNYFIPGKSWISICMYNINRFDGKTIMQVLQTHPYTISKGCMITKNPYYIHPDVWLAENAPEYIIK
ncbi:MEDS domain-containing protein [Candidatus Latescibacterota bacterium]